MKRTTKNKLLQSIWVLFLGIVFAVGAGTVFVNSGIGHSYIVRHNAENSSKNLTAKQAQQNAKRKTSYDASKTKPVSASELYRASHYPALAIGRMSIPAVNIHNPVFKGFGDHNQNLSYGVCTVLPDRTLGGINNYVLAGHYMGNYGPAILDNLHLVKAGDMVYVTDMQNIYAYRLATLNLAVDPHQVSVEDNMPNQRTITLITCSDFNTAKYGYGKHRTIAQGEETAIYPATKANLRKYELAEQNVSGHKHGSTVKAAKKTIVQKPRVKNSFLQNLTLAQIIVGFAIVWTVVMIIILVRIWM